LNITVLRRDESGNLSLILFPFSRHFGYLIVHALHGIGVLIHFFVRTKKIVTESLRRRHITVNALCGTMSKDAAETIISAIG
jgi:hypothetical protein